MHRHKVDTLLVGDKDNKLIGKASIWDIHSHYQNETMTLQDVLQEVPLALEATQSLAEAVHLISKNGIAFLPVVDQDRRLLGAITRASLVNVMSAHLGDH